MNDLEPEPMVIDPNEPGGQVVTMVEEPPAPVDNSWEAVVERWFAEHVYGSPYHSAAPAANPFSAGFREAVNYIRAALVKDPPTKSA